MYESYKDDEDQIGYFYYLQSFFFYMGSMDDCTKTQPLFKGMVEEWLAFYD